MQGSPELAERLTRMCHRNSRACIINTFATCVLMFILFAGAATIGGMTTDLAETEQRTLKLVLKTSKATYRVGEPIDITSYIENTSDHQTFYVGRDLGGFCAIVPFHYIELEIVSQNHKQIRVASSAGAGGWREGTTQMEKLQQEYVPIGPKTLYGQREACEITLKKGRYRMRAVYNELEASEWKSNERQDAPVWTERLQSNTITITVIP